MEEKRSRRSVFFTSFLDCLLFPPSRSSKGLPPKKDEEQMTRRDREIAEAMQMAKKGVQQQKKKRKSKKSTLWTLLILTTCLRSLAFSCAEIPRRPYEADKDYVRRVEVETRIGVQNDLHRVRYLTSLFALPISSQIRAELDAEKQQLAEEDNKAKRLKRQRRKEQKKAEERKRRRLEKEAETGIEEVPEKTTHTEPKQQPSHIDNIQQTKEHKKRRRRNMADVTRIGTLWLLVLRGKLWNALQKEYHLVNESMRRRCLVRVYVRNSVTMRQTKRAGVIWH